MSVYSSFVARYKNKKKKDFFVFYVLKNFCVFFVFFFIYYVCRASSGAHAYSHSTMSRSWGEGSAGKSLYFILPGVSLKRTNDVAAHLDNANNEAQALTTTVLFALWRIRVGTAGPTALTDRSLHGKIYFHSVFILVSEKSEIVDLNSEALCMLTLCSK